MSYWIALWLGVVFLILMLAVARYRKTNQVSRWMNMLADRGASFDAGMVDFNSIRALPLAVRGYFQHVLAENQKLIKTLRMNQSGLLRTSTKTATWFPFSAEQVAIPSTVGFVWNARVEMPLATHVRILDSYIDGVGRGKVSFLSAFTVASDANKPQLNSAALHRFLAEAVWYPTALLPQSGVVWTAASDDNCAIATLTEEGVTVSLEFRFNADHEVIGIYSPGRFCRSDGAYKKLPWEGHFADYQLHCGMRIPMYGEVGWYEDGALQLVWKGNVVDTEFQL